MRALIAICSKRAPTGVRNRALLVVLYRGGLRISEALDLKPKDVDAAAGTLTVYTARATAGGRSGSTTAPSTSSLAGSSGARRWA